MSLTSPDVLDPADPAHFLAPDDIIERDHPAVRRLGRELRAAHDSDIAVARAAFDWVRDNVAHSFDAQDRRATLTAGEVLRERVGLCYAKAHLLAAVLRSEGVPAGLCYQRLRSSETEHVIHGLVAVHLCGRWHRQDPRGNKPGIDARFSVDEEQLAYVVDETQGERDYRRIHRTAAPEVVAALRGSTDILTARLPAELTGPD